MASSELLHLRDPDFKIDWLEYVKQDPVHDYTERSIDSRIREDKNIFFLLKNDSVVAVLCVAFTKIIPNNINDIFDLSRPLVSLQEATHAIFYSVFRTNVTTEIKNAGAELIQSAGAWICTNLPNVTNFVTMSPIPSLRTHFNAPPDCMDYVLELLQNRKDPVARFHLANGAKVLQVLSNADNSTKRQEQSWGYMVNYRYR
jgi:malonyl-CoA decarboxylase